MKKMLMHGPVFFLLLGTLFGAAAYLRYGMAGTEAGVDTLFLLLPDGIDERVPAVQEWLDAAEEEGLHLEIIHDSRFLDPMFRLHATGLIVPDQLHRRANDALIGALEEYVHDGGMLMLVYDACTWDLNGRFPEIGSRLSHLVGVDYALYDEYGKKTMEESPIWGRAAVMKELEIPPGKFVQMIKPVKNLQLREASLQGQDKEGKGKPEDALYTFAAYRYSDVLYPSFRTSGDFDGKALLVSNAGLAAGLRKYGSGNVLFVNLPLGYLKSRTDGLLMHSFLRYFAVRLLQLPYLAPVPDAIGGLVLNWHIDAQSAIKPLEFLRSRGIFDHGPFSIHLTAGPDVDRFHDGKGLNINNNPEAQNWIQYFIRQGDEVGSHGGWIHNYFAANLTDHNQAGFEHFLAWNKDAVERAGNRPVTEYSAPTGNHPEWVTDWLEKHGILAYYFAGDAGMGPTLAYRDHGRDGSVWAFPILHLGADASFEEMEGDGLSNSMVRQWLVEIADFASQAHAARLFYTHPFGATKYIQALSAWMDHTAGLAQQGRFRWYTMTALANFLNARKAVQWSVKATGSAVILEASHAKSLNHQTWIFPKSAYGEPRTLQGRAEITDVDDAWLVTAEDCNHLRIKIEERHSAGLKAPRS
jgi:hypothetical protein